MVKLMVPITWCIQNSPIKYWWQPHSAWCIDQSPSILTMFFLASDKGNLLWDEINTVVTIFYAYENLERHL